MVIYRGSGVLNFAHGAMGMVGAYVAWEVRTKHGQPFWLALLVGVLASALLGALTHLLVMRQLRRASPLARIVATLGVLILLQGLAVIRYGARVTFVDPELPTTLVHPFGKAVSIDRFILARHRRRPERRRCGRSTVHEVRPGDDGGRREPAGGGDDRPLARPHRRPQLVARLRARRARRRSSSSPIVTLQVSTMTNLVLAAMAAALVASFRSFPIAFAAGVAIGVGQTELRRSYVDDAGRVELAAVRRDHPRDDRPGPGAAGPRLLPAEAARRRHRAGQAVAGRGRRRARRRAHGGGADELAGRDGHDVRHRHRPAVDRRRHRLRRPALARPVRPGRLRGLGRRSPRRRLGLAVRAGARSSARSRRCRSGRCSPSRPCAPVASTWPSSRSASAPRSS